MSDKGGLIQKLLKFPYGKTCVRNIISLNTFDTIKNVSRHKQTVQRMYLMVDKISNGDQDIIKAELRHSRMCPDKTRHLDTSESVQTNQDNVKTTCVNLETNSK